MSRGGDSSAFGQGDIDPTLAEPGRGTPTHRVEKFFSVGHLPWGC